MRLSASEASTLPSTTSQSHAVISPVSEMSRPTIRRLPSLGSTLGAGTAGVAGRRNWLADGGSGKRRGRSGRSATVLGLVSFMGKPLCSGGNDGRSPFSGGASGSAGEVLISPVFLLRRNISHETFAWVAAQSRVNFRTG